MQQSFDELSKHYPKLFIKDKPLLLKIEIHRDIFTDYKLSVSKREVRKFLHRYVNKILVLHAAPLLESLLL